MFLSKKDNHKNLKFSKIEICSELDFLEAECLTFKEILILQV